MDGWSLWGSGCAIGAWEFDELGRARASGGLAKCRKGGKGHADILSRQTGGAGRGTGTGQGQGRVKRMGDRIGGKWRANGKRVVMDD